MGLTFLKASNAISAKANEPAQPTGQSSVSLPPSPTSADSFGLTGPSNPPDPRLHAYRKDLADVSLAGRVIASHYAEPIPRALATATALKADPSDDGETVAQLSVGELFEMLDDSLGWAWGYAGEARLVGYVRPEALA